MLLLEASVNSLITRLTPVNHCVSNLDIVAYLGTHFEAHSVSVGLHNLNTFSLPFFTDAANKKGSHDLFTISFSDC